MQRRIRTPTVLQMEATECGAASLAIVLRHFGRVVSLLELREMCGVSRDGSDAESLLQAGALYGLEGKVMPWMWTACARSALNAPATGPRWVSLEAFRTGFTRVVLELPAGARLPARWSGAQHLALLFARLRQEWRPALFSLLAGLLLILPQLAMPIFTQVYIDDVWGSSLRQWLKPMLWAMALTVVLQAIGGQLQQLGARHLSRRLESRGGLGFERHLLALPERFFLQRYAGDVSQRLSYNREVAEFMAFRLLPLLNGSLLLILYLLLTLAYSPTLGLVVLLSTGINALLVMVSLRQQRDATAQLQKDSGRAYGALISALVEMEMVKSTAIEGYVP
jgi:ABC-type bacteriocin/lantibiotic exporter with double-glycine peptidase domain